jgi:hypothetical protein
MKLMTLETLVRLVFEEYSYLGLSDYVGLGYKEKLGNEFIGQLSWCYTMCFVASIRGPDIA